MSIKHKVAAGVVFLFGLMATIAGVGLYYLHTLSSAANNILRDNYESLVYCTHMIEQLDSVPLNQGHSIQRLQATLKQQEQNITEAGEDVRTAQLRLALEQLHQGGDTMSIVRQLRQHALAIQKINMQAIVRKHQETQQEARQASQYLIGLITIASLIAFTFIVNFPGYIANPIIQLTHSIQSIAGKNYEERLHFDRHDEFATLGAAFNQMAEKLDEYEHSNLAKLIFEKKRTETIISRMSDPVLVLDEHRQIIFVNDRATELLNLSAEAVVGRYAPDVALENDLLRTWIRQGDPAESATLVKITWQGKEEYYTRDDISIQYQPTGEEEQVKLGHVMLLRNITPYKTLDMAKTNFIATISHELKTPIAALQMCSQLLRDQRVGKLNGEQAQLLLNIDAEVRRLSAITNELLDLTQVETGNIRLQRQVHPASTLASIAVERVTTVAAQRHIRLEQVDIDRLPPMYIDLEKTVWVLVNFLTNAIRFSPEGGTVAMVGSLEENHIRFTVRDNGPGIAAEHQPHLFEKFYQVPGSTGGTGLGLAISKEFIVAQGGSIGVQSRLGHGSDFYFILPVAAL